VRDDVLARKLHYVDCPCGARLHVRAAFEYTDLDRKQFVLVLPPDELAAWQAHEQVLRDTMRQAFELGTSMVSDLVRDTRGRVVFAQDELREKLVIWSAGLDDGLVEVLKIEAFALDPSLAAPESRLLVEAIVDDRLDCVWFERAADTRPVRRIEIPASWLHRAEADRASLSTRFPELFERDGFISASRMFVSID
jgi:hypothetical protein